MGKKWATALLLALGLLWAGGVVSVRAAQLTAEVIAIGQVTGNSVNVRNAPIVVPATRLFQVNRGTHVYIHGVEGNFFMATIGDHAHVFISRDFVRVTQAKGIIAAEQARLFTMPYPHEGERVALWPQDTPVAILGTYGDWYALQPPAPDHDSYEAPAMWFVPSYMVVRPYFLPLPAVRLPGMCNLAYDIIALAMQYLGVRYQWGGNGPHSFDCSGFMVYILRPFDIRVPRRAIYQSQSGTAVAPHDRAPGDLVFFATTQSGRVTHVGMYVGEGYFIHSSSWRGRVTVDTLLTGYYARTYHSTRRVL